jgi:hypothetical protein
MRVTLAAVVCLVALMRVDSASAYAGAADSSRAISAAICAEPTLLVEVVTPGEAIGGDRSEGIDEGNTLWCVSPDDSRCSPLDASSHDGVSFGSAKLGFAAGDDLDLPKPRELAAGSGNSEYRGSARDGVFGPLERPPN